MQGFYRRDEEPLHTRRKSYVLRKMDDSDVLFPETEATSLNDADGAETREQDTVYILDCGHFAGFESNSELAGQCSHCGASLCEKCASLRCMRCLSLLCVRCARTLDGTLVCCRWCRAVVLGKRALGAGVKGLHEFLSKEF